MNQTPEQQIKRMSRRSFAWGAAYVAAGLGAWKLINDAPREDGALRPFRRVLDANGQLWSSVTSNERLAETYPLSAVQPIRTNSLIGLEDDVSDSDFAVRVEGLGDPRSVSLATVTSLPKTEVVTKFKCVEGWSRIVQAAGCRGSDFLNSLQVADLPRYAFLATPNREYYVGLETVALMHPQVLLAWEMNSEPLKPENGAPLRLFIPTRYGIKNLKRVGLVRFSHDRPTDYWYENGYDWYASH